MGDSITEGTVASIEKAEGQVINTDEVIALIETDKVTIDVRYPGSKPAVITAIKAAADETVSVGQVVAVVDDDPDKVAAAGGEASSSKEEPPSSQPAAAKESKEAKETAGALPDGGKVGAREGRTDARPPSDPPKATAEPAKAASKPSKPQQSPSPSAPPPAPGKREERRVKMTRLRLRVADRLKGAQNTYAMLTTFNEIDMSNLMAMRSAFKDAFLEAHGVKLGFMSAFIKAAESGLRFVPAVNGVIDNEEIVYRDYYDISIAVATPKGLVVPVIRNVADMGFADIEKRIVELGKKARDGALSIDEMAGGTFTISNGGVYGSLLSTPIINPPQSAILGMHSIQPRPMVVDGAVAPRPMMYVALTYDHRLIDGREAVTFLRRVKDVIEDPRRLLLDV